MGVKYFIQESKKYPFGELPVIKNRKEEHNSIEEAKEFLNQHINGLVNNRYLPGHFVRLSDNEVLFNKRVKTIYTIHPRYYDED